MPITITQKKIQEATYVSLIGPFMNYYAEIPYATNNIEAAWICNNSKLKHLWCSAYTRAQIDRMIKDYGGQIITLYPSGLDFDWYEFEQFRASLKDKDSITGIL